MFEDIPGDLLTQGGAVGILAVTVLGIVRGWLVPGSSMDKMLAVHELRLAEERARGDEWRAVARAAMARAAERDRQTELLLGVLTTTTTLMESLRQIPEDPP